MDKRTGDAPGDQWNDKVRPGMIVMSADGYRLGTAQRVREDIFHLDREAGFDLDIPYSSIQEINENFVMLKLKREELDSSRMETSPYDKHAEAPLKSA